MISCPPGYTPAEQEQQQENPAESVRHSDTDQLSIAASGQIDKLVDALISPSRVDARSLGDKPHLDEEQVIWDDTTKEYETIDILGPEILPALSSMCKLMFTSILDKEKLKRKLEGTKIPSNCEFLIPKKINHEVWDLASPTARSNDIKLQAIFSQLARSQVRVLQAAQSLSGLAKSTLPPTKEDYKSVLADLREASVMNGTATQKINQHRRDVLKFSVNTEFQNLATDVPESDKILFGDKLETRISDLADKNKAAKALKRTDKRPYDTARAHYEDRNDYKKPKKNNYQPAKQSGFASRFENREPSKNAKPSSKGAPRRKFFNNRRGQH